MFRLSYFKEFLALIFDCPKNTRKLIMYMYYSVLFLKYAFFEQRTEKDMLKNNL